DGASAANTRSDGLPFVLAMSVAPAEAVEVRATGPHHQAEGRTAHGAAGAVQEGVRRGLHLAVGAGVVADRQEAVAQGPAAAAGTLPGGGPGHRRTPSER